MKAWNNSIKRGDVVNRRGSVATTDSYWFVLPSASLRALVKRRLLARDPGLNYVCEWLDTNGFGLHVTTADWVGQGRVYNVPD
jgi:hypothetical protein